MMCGLGFSVTVELRQAAVHGAIGMVHQQHARSLMQPDRYPPLLENKFPLGLFVGGSERFDGARHDDHVGTLDTLLLQKFSGSLAEPVIEAIDHSRVGDVLVGGRVEM